MRGRVARAVCPPCAVRSPGPAGAAATPGCVHAPPPAGTPDSDHGSALAVPGPAEKEVLLTRCYGSSCQAGRRHRTALGSEESALKLK